MPETRYILEAEAQKMQGRVICGSRQGYDGTEEIPLVEVHNALAQIHKDFREREKPTLPCIITEGHLVGRTGESAYQERVYHCDFSQSPRVARLEPEVFKASVRGYAHELGRRFHQTRMYVEFDGRVEVWKAQRTEQ